MDSPSDSLRSRVDTNAPTCDKNFSILSSCVSESGSAESEFFALAASRVNEIAIELSIGVVFA